MTPDRATTLMKERADVLALARARMASQMHTVARLAGLSGLRAMVEAEMEKIASAGEDGGSWIG